VTRFDHQRVPPFVVIIVLTNVCIEHPLSRQCNTPRMSFPITNYLLFCRGMLHSSVPPKKLSLLKYLVIATEKCLTFLQYFWANCDRARREEAKKGGIRFVSILVTTLFDRVFVLGLCQRSFPSPYTITSPSLSTVSTWNVQKHSAGPACGPL
jgi:hypothetical protein